MKSSQKSFWNRATETISAKAVEKLLRFKDPQYAALLFLEFFLSLVVVASIVFWLDYRYNKLEFPFNILFFFASLFIVVRLYKYTARFRQERAMKRRTSFRIALLEFLVFAIIVASGYVYQDQRINTLPYPFNFVLFLVILLPVVWAWVNEKFLKK